jgi:hypothetical protein
MNVLVRKRVIITLQSLDHQLVPSKGRGLQYVAIYTTS